MRIVMILTNPFKPDPRAYKEATSLIKHGYEVTIIAWDREGKYPREEIVNGIRVLRIKVKSKYGDFFDFLLKLPIFYIKAFKILLRENYDVIHTSDFDTAVLGLISKVFKHKKWVYDIYDLYESLIKKTMNITIILKIIRTVDAFFQAMADVVLTASDKVTRLIFSRNQRTFTILNTVPIIDVCSNVKKKGKNRKFVVFYGGVLSRQRFILEMLKISKELNIEYRVAGVGWEEIERILKKELKGKYYGYIPMRRVLEELCRADITFAIYDPKIENNRLSIPNKVFEAAATKTPILVSKNTALASLVEDMKIGWTVEYEISDVKSILKDLMQNPKIIKRKGYIGHKIFKRNFTWETQEKKLLRIYNKL